MNNLNEQSFASIRDEDDFDFESWIQSVTLPMELAPLRLVCLKDWLVDQGFTDVQIKYQPQVDKFRVVMRLGSVQACKDDNDAEDLLRLAGNACSAEVSQVIALVSDNGFVLGTFRLAPPVVYNAANLPGPEPFDLNTTEGIRRYCHSVRQMSSPHERAQGYMVLSGLDLSEYPLEIQDLVDDALFYAVFGMERDNDALG
jgi:hypothetical protein